MWTQSSGSISCRAFRRPWSSISLCAGTMNHFVLLSCSGTTKLTFRTTRLVRIAMYKSGTGMFVREWLAACVPPHEHNLEHQQTQRILVFQPYIGTIISAAAGSTRPTHHLSHPLAAQQHLRQHPGSISGRGAGSRIQPSHGRALEP